MSQSLAQIYIHLVFSTKDREPCISTVIHPKLHAYLAGTLNAVDCPALCVGGMPDHVHLLFSTRSHCVPLGCGEDHQGGIFEVDEDTGQHRPLCLAVRLRCFFRQCIPIRNGHSLHSESSRTPRGTDFPKRVQTHVGTLPNQLQRSLCVGLRPFIIANPYASPFQG